MTEHGSRAHDDNGFAPVPNSRLDNIPGAVDSDSPRILAFNPVRQMKHVACVSENGVNAVGIEQVRENAVHRETGDIGTASIRANWNADIRKLEFRQTFDQLAPEKARASSDNHWSRRQHGAFWNGRCSSRAERDSVFVRPLDKATGGR